MNVLTFTWRPERGLYCAECHMEYKNEVANKVFERTECPFCGSKLLRWCADFIRYDY